MGMAEGLPAEAANAVRWAAGTQLTPAGWVQVAEALSVLETGWAAGDERTVRHAIRALDGALRITRLGDQPDDPDEEPVPVPPDIRERINRLVDRILPDIPGDQTHGGQAGGGQGG